MSTKKFEELSMRNPEDEIKGLVLRKGEKTRLYDICVKYGVTISYPTLFTDDIHYPLWGISKNGIGLVGTIIMNYLEQNGGTIFHTLEEFEEYLKGRQL